MATTLRDAPSAASDRGSATPSASPLREHLESLYRTFDVRWISPDPLELARRYDASADQEIAGFLAAGLAYGRVEQIMKSGTDLLDRLGPSPAAFVRRFDARRDGGALRGWYHRFHGARDMVLLMTILARALDEHGTLEAAFLAGDDPDATDIGTGLDRFVNRLAESSGLPAGPGVTRGRLTPDAPVRYFFAAPKRGSACKRLNLWLRWMVRGGDGLDLGAWRRVDRARLVIPLDTHVARIARYIGLTARTTLDWRAALDVTAGLRRLDPADPVKYDFAICRLGILDHCPRRRDPVRCEACLLKPVCTL